MDMMEIRRRVLVKAMASGATIRTGTFTGDGTINASILIGFEPDVLLIESDSDYSTSGWAGIGHIIFWRAVNTVVTRHNSSSATSVTTNAYPNLTESAPYGTANDAPTYCAVGSYSNGTFEITNKTDGNGTRLRNGVTYSWTAIKY